MHPLTPYLAIASAPLATLLAPNPTRFSWAFRHGTEPMPPDLQEKAGQADRYWYFFVDTITVAFVVGLMFWDRVPPDRVGLQFANWKEGAVVGMAAALLRLVLMGALAGLFPWAVSRRNDPHVLWAQSVPVWTATFFCGALSEELWITFCLVAFMATGHSVAVSVFITALVFGTMHFEYRIGALTIAMYGAVSALLFVWLRSLISMFLFHFIGNLGSLYLHRWVAQI